LEDDIGNPSSDVNIDGSIAGEDADDGDEDGVSIRLTLFILAVVTATLWWVVGIVL
jgi:hypothetical protein